MPCRMQVWAYANLGHDPGSALLDAIATTSVQAMGSFSPQNLSNTLWSFAKLGRPHRDLFSVSAAHMHMPSMMRQFQAQSVV